jgi:hypothetical protein
MSKASRERQLKLAQETENFEGLFNYRKANRRKIPMRAFWNSGKMGTAISKEKNKR